MTLDVNTAAALQVGEVLKAAREKQNISTKQVATALNLPERFILYIESGEFDKLPGNTFVRGYIRNYIKYLHLEDEQGVISLFEQQATPETKEGKMLDFKQIKRFKSVSNSIYWLISFIVCIVLAGILFLMWQHYSSTTTNEQNMVAIANTNELAAPNIPLNTDNTQTIIPLTGINTDTDTDTVTVDIINDDVNEPEDEEAPQQNETTIADTTPVQASTTSANVKKGEGRIQATFSANCWLSVKDATGKELVQGVFSPKRKLDITGKAPLDIMFGAPNTVSLTYNGKPIKIDAKSNTSHRMKLGN